MEGREEEREGGRGGGGELPSVVLHHSRPSLVGTASGEES